jgi:hypothetical protein
VITIKIDTKNAAFDENKYIEVARILNELSKQLEEEYGGGYPIWLFDINGNRVGELRETNSK